MAAKRTTGPSDSTSHNIYFRSGGGRRDTRIDKEYRSAESGETPSNHWKNQSSELPLSFEMSPQVLYTIQDAAEILAKAPVTVRKEAHDKQIGTLKGHRYLFTDRDVLALCASFEEKEERRRHPLDQPKDEIPVARALFERVVYLTDVMMEFKRDRDRFLIMFQEIFDQYRAFVEETEKRLNKLERGR